MQPAWSPHGHRIAYFALRANSGQRDIFTVPADGSGADVRRRGDQRPGARLDAGVVAERRLPVFLEQPRRHDELVADRDRRGHAAGTRGEPEPVTTPIDLQRTHVVLARRAAMATPVSTGDRRCCARRSIAAREERRRTADAVFKGSRPIRDHAISPDGQWVVFNEITPQEDLFVARVDGREYRRLTDDVSRDRGPMWSPDGQTIYFYSDRSGTTTSGRISPDGSPAHGHERRAAAEFPHRLARRPTDRRRRA